MRYERGDVVLLDMPFSDGTSRKKRPALVVANEAYLAGTSDLILCAITGQMRVERFPGATTLEFWQEAGLLKESVVKAFLYTVDRALVYRRLGRVTARDLSRVDDSLRSVLF